MLQCLILCVSLFVTKSVANVAPFLKPCPPTDSKCIVNSAKIALPHFASGIPELGIPATDPLIAKNININTDGLQLSVKDMTVHGLGKCKFNTVERDITKSTGLLNINCPIECLGDYVLKGKLFLLDIEGEGPFQVKGDNLNVIVTIKLKQNTKAGKKYYKITGFDYSYEPISDFKFKLYNLYNGDKEKAAPVEKLMEQNGKELMLGLGKPIIKEVITRMVENVGKFFQSIPAEEIEVV